MNKESKELKRQMLCFALGYLDRTEPYRRDHHSHTYITKGLSHPFKYILTLICGCLEIKFSTCQR